MRGWGLIRAGVAGETGADACSRGLRHLIDRRVMVSAVALNFAIWQGTQIIAPAVAGFLMAWAGTAVAFYLAG